MPPSIMTEIGSGELIDKITILEIKSDRITDVEKLKNVKDKLITFMNKSDRTKPFFILSDVVGSKK